MIEEIFTVLDMVANRYLEPFTAPTIAYALRGFETASEKEGHPFHEHPSDYALYHVGAFDGESGLLHPAEPRKLAVASSFKAKTARLEVSG